MSVTWLRVVMHCAARTYPLEPCLGAVHGTVQEGHLLRVTALSTLAAGSHFTQLAQEVETLLVHAARGGLQRVQVAAACGQLGDLRLGRIQLGLQGSEHNLVLRRELILLSLTQLAELLYGIDQREVCIQERFLSGNLFRLQCCKVKF